MFMETIKFDLNWEKFNLFWIEIWACLDWCEFYGFIEKYCSHSAVCLLIWNQFKRDVIFHSTNIFPQKNSIITSFFVFWIKIVLHCWIDVKKKFFNRYQFEFVWCRMGSGENGWEVICLKFYCATCDTIFGSCYSKSLKLFWNLFEGIRQCQQN